MVILIKFSFILYMFHLDYIKIEFFCSTVLQKIILYGYTIKIQNLNTLFVVQK